MLATETLSVTEQAKLDFLQSAREIPGVTVEVYGHGTLIEQSIRVNVPDVVGQVADSVYELIVRIRRQYRYARLNVEVEQAQ